MARDDRGVGVEGLGRIARLRGEWRALRAWLGRRGLALLVGLGIAIRLGDYQEDRHFWLDEQALSEAIVGRPIYPLGGPLPRTQLAPPGFLVLQRAVARGLGASRRTLRLWPLACGITSLLLVGALARRLLDPGAATLAVALFAVSYDPIYYATEMKPYSSDVAIALGCTLAALGAAERRLSGRRALALLALAGLAPWFSFPSAFVIAGTGLCLLVRKWHEGRRGEAAALAAVGLAWGASFAASQAVSRRLLDDPGNMWTFWDFAFLPVPRDLAALRELGRGLLEVLVNPGNLVDPAVPIASAALAMLLLVAGAAALVRRRGLGLAMLALPAVLAALASAGRRYPFHGRLILFLVPAIDLLTAEGAVALGRRAGRPLVAWALAALVLIHPVAETAYYEFVVRNRDWNGHGDLRLSPFERPLPISPPPRPAAPQSRPSQGL